MDPTIFTALAAAAIFKGKEIFNNLMSLVVRFTSVSLTVTNEDAETYRIANKWINTSGIIKKPRRAELVSNNKLQQESRIFDIERVSENKGGVEFINSNDLFYGFYKKGLISVYFSTSRSQMNKDVIRSVTINFFFRSAAFLEKTKQEIFAFVEKERVQDKVLIIKNNYLERGHPTWEITRAPIKDIDTIFLPDNKIGIIKEDITRFITSKSIYNSFGKTYKRNYVIVGPPGTGKTSLAKAISGLYTGHMSVIPTQCDDGAFSACILSANTGVILIEDIDCTSISIDRKPGSNNDSSESVSLSAVLNALDGVNTKDGCINIITTNKPEDLDPAILRKGRTDVLLELGYLNEDQLKECLLFFEKLLGVSIPFTSSDFEWASYGIYEGYKPCDISEKVFDHIRNKK